jgi:hypothetical protein
VMMKGIKSRIKPISARFPPVRSDVPTTLEPISPGGLTSTTCLAWRGTLIE